MAQSFFKDDSQNNKGGTPKKQVSGRSIRNISVPARKRVSKRTTQAQQSSGGSFGSALSSLPSRPKSRWGIWSIAGISVLILLIAASFLVFRDTTVTVTPREHTVVFDEETLFTAFPAGENAPEGAVVYTTQETTLEESTTVEAGSIETVEERASGTLTVVNDHRESGLRLIKNTRFQTPAGLVYRIRDSVVVPGKSGGTPGTLEVTVYADEPGERYNIGPVERFTLPGLKTTAPEMFDTVYARSSSSMTGGFVGERPVVDQDDQARARTTLRTQLQEKAEGQTESDTDGFVFSELSQIQFESPPPELADSGSVNLVERAHIITPLFSEQAFAKGIAQATSADAGEGTITIPDPSTFDIILRSEDVELGIDPIDFSLSGTARFVWHIDTVALAENLAGVRKETFQSILEGYPGVEEADAQIRPFWSSTFPENPESIVIKMQETTEE